MQGITMPLREDTIPIRTNRQIDIVAQPELDARRLTTGDRHIKRKHRMGSTYHMTRDAEDANERLRSKQDR